MHRGAEVEGALKHRRKESGHLHSPSLVAISGDLKEGAMPDLSTLGSQGWLRTAIELHPGVLLKALRRPLGLAATDTIEWRSPIRATGFEEYRDGAALRLVVKQKLRRRSLKNFWPARGPVWDALGVVSGGWPIFVEAKASIAEAVMPVFQASPESLRLISKSMEETRKFYAPNASAGWTRMFYQYTSRLAHHYLLRELNGIESHLVFLYFLNADVDGGLSSRARWEGAIELVHTALGLTRFLSEGLHEAFVDVRELS
jgi:hypothetical protein